MTRPTSWNRGAVAAVLLAASPALPAAAQSLEERRARGAAVIRELNTGQAQPNLEALRREFPFLAEATEAYALGDVWGRSRLDNRTRQLATVAAFAALGIQPILKVHAGYALNLGVGEDELKEIVHLTTVHAGFARAIEAAQTLSALFAERRAVPGARP